MYIYIHKYTYIYMYMYIYTCMYMYIYTYCTYISEFIRDLHMTPSGIYIIRFKCIYIWIYIIYYILYVNTCIYMYTNINKNIYKYVSTYMYKLLCIFFLAVESNIKKTYVKVILWLVWAWIDFYVCITLQKHIPQN
jgi:hypothetical protein